MFGLGNKKALDKNDFHPQKATSTLNEKGNIGFFRKIVKFFAKTFGFAPYYSSPLGYLLMGIKFVIPGGHVFDAVWFGVTSLVSVTGGILSRGAWANMDKKDRAAKLEFKKEQALRAHMGGESDTSHHNGTALSNIKGLEPHNHVVMGGIEQPKQHTGDQAAMSGAGVASFGGGGERSAAFARSMRERFAANNPVAHSAPEKTKHI